MNTNSITKKIEKFSNAVDKNYDLKTLYYLIDETVNNSINLGNLHFAITINLMKNKVEYYSEENLKKELHFINKIISSNIELWTFSYSAVEYHKKSKRPHIHMIIGVRSLIGYNDVLAKNIENLIRNHYEMDTEVVLLKTEIDCKLFFKYVIKEIKEEYNLHFFRFLSNYQEEFVKLIDYILFNMKYYALDAQSWGNEFEKQLKYKEIRGRVLKEKHYNQQTMISFWLYYIHIKNLFIYNNILYEKVNNFLVSFKKFEKVEILYEKFIDLIFNFYSQEFSYHFSNFDIYNFSINHFIKSEELIEKLKELTFNNFTPNFNILEFKDGIYYISLNKFIPKKQIIDCMNNSDILKNIFTLKYYNKTFKHLTEPKEWLQNLNEALDTNETEKDILCIYIANIFHQSDILLKKKKALYIKGESNTKKTTLIAKPLRQFFGDENVGYLNTSSEFTFQNIIGKKVVLLDEFHYSNYKKKHKSNFLKLIGGEPLTINMKFAEPMTINEQKPIIVIMISNTDIEEDDKEIQTALNNRIYKIIFKKKINPNSLEKEIDKLLQEEEPNIIVYCNKIYFKYLNKELNKTRTKLSYKKTLEFMRSINNIENIKF